MFGETDLRAFFRTGPRVAFGGVSAYPDGQPVQGLFDRGQKSLLGVGGFGGITVGLPTLTLPFNAFDPMPDEDDALTLDGVAYTVSEVVAQDDGGMATLRLKLAS